MNIEDASKQAKTDQTNSAKMVHTPCFFFGTSLPQTADMSVDLAEKIVTQGLGARAQASALPQHTLFAVLEEVRRLWNPATSQYVRQMQDVLPRVTGFSPEMISLGLNELQNLLDTSELQKKLDTEFGKVPRGPDFLYCPKENRILRYAPIGSVLHILSGNVFLVGPGSLVEGLITGNVTLLKMSSDETLFLPLFLETICEAERNLGLAPCVSSTIAAFVFKSSQTEIIKVFQQTVDGIVVWGGESAVNAYRNNLPARTRFIVFGPKLSVAMVLDSGLKEKGFERCAKNLALELGVWDQNACTAPQVCFVEGAENAKILANAMVQACREMQLSIPAGGLDANQAAEIRKIRSIFEVKDILDEGKLVSSGQNLDWTIYIEHGGALEPSPLHRTLKIVPIQNVSEVFTQVENLRAYIQTVGLWVSDREVASFSHELGDKGVLRVMELGQMSGGSIDDPHDGMYDLPQLMQLVVGRFTLPNQVRPFELLSEEHQNKIITSRLHKSLLSAKKLPLYERLNKHVINAVSEIHKIAPFSKAEIQLVLAGLPEDRSGGFVTRTGGSTGKPAYSYFDALDWKAMVEAGVSAFRACGFNELDRVANFMFAGDLYGSFISFCAVNEALGAKTFPFASKHDPESLLEVWKMFGVNAVQGVPPTLMPFLRKAKEQDSEFRIEKVMTSGSPLSQADRVWLKDILGASVICSIIGTTEAGMIGYQTAGLAGGHHKLLDDYNYVEVLDENGTPVSLGEVGQIAVTSLQKRAAPVIRYLIGDKGRILKSANGFGRVLHYMGRADDILCFGKMNFSVAVLETVLEGLGVSTFQVELQYGQERENLSLKVELNADDKFKLTPDAMKAQLLKLLPDLQHDVANKDVSFEIHILETGAIPRSERTGKIQKIIDGRIT